MTIQYPALLARRAATVAALTLAVVGTVSVPAFARSVVPCADSSSVKLPGEAAVANAPAHHGSPTLTVSSDGEPRSGMGSAVWTVRLTETNNTGAAYQHVTPVLGFFTRLGVIGMENGYIQVVRGSSVVPLDVHPGCDPSVWMNSALLDGPLADGQSVSFDFYISTPTEVAQQVESLAVFAAAGADGDKSPASNYLELPGLMDPATGKPSPVPSTTPGAAKPSTVPATPTGKPVAKPTGAPAGKPATVPLGKSTSTSAPVVAAADTVVSPSASAAAPTQAPTANAATAPVADPARLAATGGDGNRTTLIGVAVAVIATGTALVVGLKRRARRN